MSMNKKGIGKSSVKVLNSTKKVTRNINKIPVKLWKSFGQEGKEVFNKMMEKTLKIQDLIKHPDQKTMSQEQWKTICWNMSCLAAWAADKENLNNINVE